MAECHFVLFPFMAQGHLLPMVNIGRLLAQHGVIVTTVTTPLNAGRVEKLISRADESGHPIRVSQLWFPGKEVGLPDGAENIDMLHSMDDMLKFYAQDGRCSTEIVRGANTTPHLHHFGHEPVLYAQNCCQSSKILEEVKSDSEYFTVPGLPHKVEFTKAQVPLVKVPVGHWEEIFGPIFEADRVSYGVVINTFEELESAYVDEYRKVKKAWCIGPVSLSHKDESDKAERGNKASINEKHCMQWLDSQETNSVIYACLGSFGSVKCSELIELGLGLEASNKPFI
ncbi:UDP-Glycosyltransferase superfamily protein [Hibiscus syriacus]|uniref:UDP-Glycosyltransferase superfamily protein n=1 Tax=Hibiscus syriacus TaxID=106335 RepID=A0A6A2YPC5_HIBSY|nr:UDP-Glycosyltransferase superfamily protein [Hibiscus syriacus]